MSSILFAMLAGVSIAVENSLNGLMNPFVGAMGASLVCYAVQLIAFLVYLAVRRKEKVQLRKAPFVCYLGGLQGGVIMGVISFCVFRMGTAVTTCCSVAGQILLSALVDHFGLLGAKKQPFSPRRIPGFLMLLAGVLVINLAGGARTGDAPLWLLLTALLIGGTSVLVRLLNFRASQAAGSPIGGGMTNSIGGVAGGLLLYVLSTGLRPDLAAFGRIPPLYLFSGVLGAVCLLANVAAYRKSNVFYATVFMLIGQVGTGIVMDLLLARPLSAGKLIGIAILLAGVTADKLLTRKKA